MSTQTDLADERALLLARVSLTRRLNVDVHPFEGRDDGLDLICTVRDNRARGFLQFGVMVWGTAKERCQAAMAFAIAVG